MTTPILTVAVPLTVEQARKLSGNGARGAQATRLRKEVRERAGWEARAEVPAALRPVGVPVAAVLTYRPDHRRVSFDADNISPMVKPVLDGLRDAGVLRDDTKRFVASTTNRVGEQSAMVHGMTGKPIPLIVVQLVLADVLGCVLPEDDAEAAA